MWYFDVWMPQVATLNKAWGKETRYFNLLTDKKTIPGLEAAGGVGVIITPATEAFGLVLLENNHTKWKNQFTFRKQNQLEKLPRCKKGKENEQYKSLWTEEKKGRVFHGGWEEEGLIRFEEIRTNLKKYRAQDAARAQEEKLVVIARKLMREEHRITADSYTSPKKRKTAIVSDLEENQDAENRNPKKRITIDSSEDEDAEEDEDADDDADDDDDDSL